MNNNNLDQLIQLHQINEVAYVNRIHNRRENLFRDRFDIDDYDDVELYDKFRFRRRALFDLVDLLEPTLPAYANRNYTISTEQRLCIALRTFSSGCFQEIAGDTFGVDKSTVSRTITPIIDSLIMLAPRFITTDHFNRPYNLNYFVTKNLPNVIGSIDCTHVKIKSPSHFEYEFINRKGFHSINVQAIGTSELLFADVVANWAGGTHDSRILNESAICVNFTNGAFGDSILLGDQGYALRNWLYTPVDRANLTPQERRFNVAHRSARSSIERSFGVLKKRWNSLHTGLRYKPVKCARLIMACAVLHNFSILQGDLVPPEANVDVNEEVGEQNDPLHEMENVDARAHRATYILNNFR